MLLLCTYERWAVSKKKKNLECVVVLVVGLTGKLAHSVCVG
jgi:hypothetical protein